MVSLAPLASASSDSGGGTGVAAQLGELIDSGMVQFVEYARIRYEDADLNRISFGGLLYDRYPWGFELEPAPPASATWIYSLGCAAQWDDRGAWGVGPRCGIGWCVRGRRLSATLLAEACAWLGSDGQDFDAGIEGQLRLALGATSRAASPRDGGGRRGRWTVASRGAGYSPRQTSFPFLSDTNTSPYAAARPSKTGALPSAVSETRLPVFAA